MITNETVVQEWNRGRKASNRNLSTDGVKLYSYNLLIGDKAGGIIYNHTAGGGSYYSQTTSCHVGLAARLSPSAKIINP
tara:strand:+ start:486 stop:722 length:237 start_codon:yes stop_codon:yes gene_type:complete